MAEAPAVTGLVNFLGRSSREIKNNIMSLQCSSTEMFNSARMAELLASYSLNLRRGDLLAIYANQEAFQLVRELYEKALHKGAYPYAMFWDEVLDELFMELADESTLRRVPQFLITLQEEMTARASILSSTHTKHLIGADPERVRRVMKARERFTEIFMERQSSGELRWVVAPYPTRAMAQEAGMGPVEFELFVERACMLDEPDPIEAWRDRSRVQGAIAARLDGTRVLEIKGENVDLKVSVGGRIWINDAGEKNMPGGEVFTGPVEESVEGWIKFTYPAVWRGIEVEGVELKFEKGAVAEARAEEGEEKLLKILETDLGAKRVGELAFGLNDKINRFTRMILFDEKIGGTMHIALGASYPDTGGRNKSAIHWDMITDMSKSKVYADDKLIYENGSFII